MGCYGVGVSRLLAAAVEHGCSTAGSEGSLVWPRAIAPYQVCILPVTTVSCVVCGNCVCAGDIAFLSQL